MAAKNKPKPKPGLSRFFGKAQGSLEYLLLIGGAVVVAVIVVYIAIGLAGSTGNYTAGQTQQALSYYKYLVTTPEEDLWNIMCLSTEETGYSLEITSEVVGPPSGVSLSAETMNALFTAAGHPEITVENDVECKIDPGAGEGISGGLGRITVLNGTLQSLLIGGGGISCDGLRFGAGEQVNVTLSGAKKFGLIYGQSSAVDPVSLLVTRKAAPFPTGTISLPEGASGLCLLWYGPLPAAS